MTDGEREILDRFCACNDISHSAGYSSFYFLMRGKYYRVSDHTVQESNNGAYRDGKQVRDLYHMEDCINYDILIDEPGKVVDVYNSLKGGVKVEGMTRLC